MVEEKENLNLRKNHIMRISGSLLSIFPGPIDGSLVVCDVLTDLPFVKSFFNLISLA